jgi:hypothetical protein
MSIDNKKPKSPTGAYALGALMLTVVILCTPKTLPFSWLQTISDVVVGYIFSFCIILLIGEAVRAIRYRKRKDSN